MGVLKEIFASKMVKGNWHGDALIETEPQATLSTEPVSFDESKHPRGQPDNAGKFSEKATASRPPIDTSKPHFAGTNDAPHAFFVQPGAGENGTNKETYELHKDYIPEISKHMTGSIASEIGGVLDRVSEIAADGDDPDVVREAISDTLHEALDGIYDRIEKWESHFHANTKRVYGDDSEMVPHSLKEAVNHTKRRIMEALCEDDGSPLMAAYEMSEEDSDTAWDPEVIEESAENAKKQVSAALSELKDAFHGHRENLDTAIDERDDRHKEDASSYTDTMNDDYESDGDSPEAIEQATELNADLASEKNQYRIHYDEDSATWEYGYQDDLEDYPGKESDDAEKPTATLSTQSFFDGHLIYSEC